MISSMRLQPRLQSTVSLLTLGRPSFAIYGRRAYANGEGKAQKDKSDQSTNYPIPSNKAEPTLHDGRQSPIADHEGHLRKDLPQDVKEHNKDMDNRYDKPYNHIADEGNIEGGWEKK